MSERASHLVVIGGGAAGFFAAIRAAEHLPNTQVTLLEATRKVLTKVHLSGGGRCNATHHCFDPAQLASNYPRGARELRAAFSRFQPRDTVDWFAQRGVALKAEADGRMFPVTDDAATIASCLESSAARAGVTIRLGASVASLVRAMPPGGFLVTLKDGSELSADRVLLATGSAPAGLALAASLGHRLEPHVPSLFTFNLKDPRLDGLSGVSFPLARLIMTCGEGGERFERSGPLLITHWGLSGPAVLKLSAFGAIALHACGYHAGLRCNFLGSTPLPEALATLRSFKDQNARKQIAKNPPFAVIPRRFWESLVAFAGLSPQAVYADLPKEALRRLAEELTEGRYQITGKGVFKEEFVSAGGVNLKEVDFRTMESRLCPGLYFAGEVLAIDGITGGFNFQAAWTTAWIAASASPPKADGPP